MAEQTLHNLDGGDTATKDPKELIEDWVRVIDRWVQRIDQGMGGSTDGADPAMAPDSALEAVPDPPALEAG